MNLKILLAAILAILIVGWSVYRDIMQHREIMARVQAIIQDPAARPDAYTGTMAAQDQADLRAWVQAEIARVCKEMREKEKENHD